MILFVMWHGIFAYVLIFSINITDGCRSGMSIMTATLFRRTFFTFTNHIISLLELENLATGSWIVKKKCDIATFRKQLFIHSICLKREILTNLAKATPLGDLSIENVLFVTLEQSVGLAKLLNVKIFFLQTESQRYPSQNKMP